MRTRFLRRRCNGSPEKKAIKRYFIIFVCAVIGLQLCGLSFFRDEKPKSAASPVSRQLLSSVEWEKCDWEIDHTRNYSDPSSWYAPSKAYNFVAIYTLMILIVFVALAIICDDFFVPSLEAISEKLDLSEDVAGATFMAAGSSAPELFTSIAGVAVESDVGVGTIVGSAVFNLLGICALSAAFAGKVLILDWKPLTRDATFYGLSIAFFILFAHDGKFELYESIIMLVNYFIYILIMKFNPKLMELMSRLEKNKKVDPAAPCETAENCDETEGAKDSSHSFDDGEDDMESIIVCPCLPPVVADIPVHHGSGCLSILRYILSWILFLVSFPFVIMFTWTIPTCATPETKKYYMFSFVMSIAWIAALSFGMVTLVGRAGCILGIDKFTMGLVVVAIGTSIPDALSSVLVARDGYGDMAVSNAIGSNVFDIDLGIGLPFVISSLIRNFKPVHLLAPTDQAKYDAGHLPIIPHVKFGFILLAILFVSLAIFVVVRFRLNKYLGCAFVGIYVCFVSYAYIQDIYCQGTC